MKETEYWLKEGRKLIDSLKEWNPSGIFPEDLLVDYFKRYDQENINAALGDLSDAVKDRGISQFVNLLRRTKFIIVPTEEIKSEVLDYLKRHDYEYVVDNNKIGLI